MKTAKEIAIKAIEHSIFCDRDILTEYFDSADNYFESNFGCTVDEAEEALECKFGIRDYWGDRIWAEIRNTHFDENERKFYIDAWLTDDDCEEGAVIAKIGLDGDVEYIDKRAETDVYAQEAINEVKPLIPFKSLSYKAYYFYITDWCSVRGYNPANRDSENGFGGEDYACFNEFMDCEFQDESYVGSLVEQGLLSEEEFEIWKENRKE